MVDKAQGRRPAYTTDLKIVWLTFGFSPNLHHHRRGYVVIRASLFVCLFVCLFISSYTQKSLSRLSQTLVEMKPVGHARNCIDFGSNLHYVMLGLGYVCG